jgi:hypothetical protein
MIAGQLACTANVLDAQGVRETAAQAAVRSVESYGRALAIEDSLTALSLLRNSREHPPIGIELILETAAHHVAHVHDGLVCEAIEHIETFLPSLHEADAMEHLQVARRVRLAQLRVPHEIRDRLLARAQCLQDTQTRGFAERLEARGDPLQQLGTHLGIRHF